MYFTHVNTKSNRFDSWWLGLFIFLIIGPGLHSIQAANPTTADIFYVPTGSNAILLDGQWSETEWSQGNYFTFGYEGKPEVKLYAFWLNTSTENTLNLAIHIDDKTRLLDFDRLVLCFDPPNNGAQLYRFDLKRSNSAVLYSKTGTGDWIYTSDTSIQYQTYSLPDYWEAEVKIPLTLLENNNLPFGMYLRVFDYFYTEVNATPTLTYIQFYWPGASATSSLAPNVVPPASDWANGYLINPNVPTRPDPFFSNREQVLYMDNANHDIQIVPGHENIMVTKINNHFLNGAMDIDNVHLSLQWSTFGVTDFQEIPITTPSLLLPQNADKVTSNSWTPDANLSGNLILRAAVQKDGDAITGNNGTRRDMMFIRVREGDVAKVEAIVTDPGDTEATPRLGFTSLNSSRKNYYFLIDRSGLDSTIADSLWQINFYPPAGDTLRPAGKDRFWLAFQSKETKKFQLEVTAPVISSTPSKNWILKLFYFLFFKADTLPGVLVAPPTAAQPEGITTRLKAQNFPGHPDRSRIRIQVAKADRLFSIDKIRHQHLSLSGYFGVEIEILRTRWILDWIKLLSFILIIGGLAYYIWRRRNPGR
ncbi:hypothetical protein L0128_00935 [candidate division KSB1 bacterium]|nr:hypothetical protein [candidate division KSB1 bacterium]